MTVQVRISLSWADQTADFAKYAKAGRAKSEVRSAKCGNGTRPQSVCNCRGCHSFLFARFVVEPARPKVSSLWSLTSLPTGVSVLLRRIFQLETQPAAAYCEPAKESMNTDYDGGWKEALDRYLQPFLPLCFPQVATEIDWSKPVEFLDKELQEVVRDAEQGKLRVDKLIKVFDRNGEEEWLLLHIEIQSQTDPDLPTRIYHYNHRLADRYARTVVSLIVLADDNPNWRPDHYEAAKWGCRVRLDYPICKLLDLSATAAIQNPGNNPAAVLIAAHLAALETKHNISGRKERRWALTRRLYESGFEKQDILELYRLIDWLMWLPEGLAVAFRRQVIQYEAEKSMPYVTSTERLARAEGRQEGRQEDILDILRARFNDVPYALCEQVKAIHDENALRECLRDAALLPTLDAFQAKLRR